MTNVKVKQQDGYYWLYDTDCFENISETYFTALYWKKINAIEGARKRPWHNVVHST